MPTFYTSILLYTWQCAQKHNRIHVLGSRSQSTLTTTITQGPNLSHLIKNIVQTILFIIWLWQLTNKYI